MWPWWVLTASLNLMSFYILTTFLSISYINHVENVNVIKTISIKKNIHKPSLDFFILNLQKYNAIDNAHSSQLSFWIPIGSYVFSYLICSDSDTRTETGSTHWRYCVLLRQCYAIYPYNGHLQDFLVCAMILFSKWNLFWKEFP